MNAILEYQGYTATSNIFKLSTSPLSSLEKEKGFCRPAIDDALRNIQPNHTIYITGGHIPSQCISKIKETQYNLFVFFSLGMIIKLRA